MDVSIHCLLNQKDKEDMPNTISVIVPVYNVAPYLKRCINSIVEQSYEGIEIIAVDDGSTDCSYTVLKELQAEYDCIKVIHQDNQGVVKARIEGIKAATGNWIGFIDGDDEIEYDMYTRLLMNALEYNADISHCGYQINDKDQVRLFYGTERKVFQNNEQGVLDLLEGTFIEPSLCNKLFRKSLFDSLLNNPNMDYTIRNYEDLLMNYYLFRQSQSSIYEDICLYHYIKREGSASASEANEHFLGDPIKVLKIIRNDNIGNKKIEDILNRRIGENLIWLSTIKGDTEVVEQYRRSALIELRNMLVPFLIGNNSIKFKIKVLIAAIIPELYRTLKKYIKKSVVEYTNE